MTIRTNPQGHILTTVRTSRGNKSALLSSKQYIYTRLSDLNWHSVSEFTSKISRSGFRARLSEMTSRGFVFGRTYDSFGKMTRIRMAGVPEVGIIRATA